MYGEVNGNIGVIVIVWLQSVDGNFVSGLPTTGQLLPSFGVQIRTYGVLMPLLYAATAGVEAAGNEPEGVTPLGKACANENVIDPASSSVNGTPVVEPEVTVADWVVGELAVTAPPVVFST